VAGSVDRPRNQTNGKFRVHCFSTHTRVAIALRALNVDKATLILRQGQDGRFSQVDLADLFQGDPHDNIVASVAFTEDPKDHAHLVYWLVVKPQNAKYPVPEEVIEETYRSGPPQPTAPANP
jgi:hypothetical protein